MGWRTVDDDEGEDGESNSPRDAMHNREYPDEADIEDGDEPAVDTCPYCGKSVIDDAVQCPHCGNYLSREDAPQRKPKWIVAGVVIVIAILVWWTFTGR